MIEVEVKAWVDDPAAVRALLDARYPLVGTYRKEDTYFRLREGARGEPAREFRIRREAGRAAVTSKEKRMVDGVEVNQENEFTVSDPQAFERFVLFVGAELFVRKVKVGRLYDASGADSGAASGAGGGCSLHIELSDVERLGTFIEIEEMLDDDDPAEIERAQREVRVLLSSVGIDPARIEGRYYIDMIAALDKERR